MKDDLRTIRLKLDFNIPDGDAKKSDLMSCISIYTEAYNHACSLGFHGSYTFRNDFQTTHYHQFRELYGLNSQLTCSVFSKAWESVESARALENQKYPRAPHSDQQSIRYDINKSYSIQNKFKKPKIIDGYEPQETEEEIFLRKSSKFLSINSGKNRTKLPLIIPKCYFEYFEKPWEMRSAELCVKKNDIFLHIVFLREVDVPQKTKTSRIFGVDRGVKRAAVIASTDLEYNKFHHSKEFNAKINNIKELTSRLQKAAANGSQSAKRHLRELSGRRRRFTVDYLHRLANDILRKLNKGDVLVFENLKGIRSHHTKKKRKSGKKTRTMLNSWAFAELQRILTYKALGKGVVIEIVEPAYTSQNCSKCGFCSKSNRRSQSRFKCRECEYDLDADLNGARNIAIIGQLGYMPNCRASVNEPHAKNRIEKARFLVGTTTSKDVGCVQLFGQPERLTWR